ncbi:kinetochore protein spc25 [Phtheirospermum japonicum]|uniref:Kinetochore protein SPC25 n=1 Tax=Phtheirospermum japonicum TaxID=374723 RepID=A0A830C3J0_9LAMI|nr:kinetochore protein spc25 [Phtheirospermum japonicum]
MQGSGDSEKLGKLKGELREAEDALVKALSVKTRKEAKRMAMMESISATKARVEELNGLVEDQRERKDEYAAIISQQFEAHKEKCAQNREHKEQIEEAISWYNRILGFRIEPGHGVKFIFTNINRDNPNEEYSFIIRHENDIYTLLNCVPHLSDTKEMVNELNKTNGLFKFVRTMREKFQESAARGIPLHRSSLDQDTSIISLSAPVSSVSTNHSYESPRSENGLQFAESNTSSRKVGKGHIIHSPQSSALRRSARLKAKN